ncbi:ferredoxin [Kluyvera ascorbata]|uniref:Ferredoxin n=1 Tax=Kluyvera ascorbata TaxID=51288 RepID=A0A3N2S873_9ENTR|nr:ferredoxin [Kluyvera ascorbata]
MAYCLANFFIADAITQTNVHNHSRSISEQSVSENNYDYNSQTRQVA